MAINTFAIGQPEFISEASREFGSQCIVLYVEAKKQPDGSYEAYTDGGREHSGIDAVAWAKRGVELGAGEIFISSIDRDGTRKGYDIDLLKRITAFATVPVIAHGGAGMKESVAEAVKEGKADAVAMSSVFHYQDFAIAELKKSLQNEHVSVRL